MFVTIEQAAESLLAGGVVIFPTDTVYGVGAHAFNADAIAAVYAIKERPLDKGLPILLSDAEQLGLVVDEAAFSAETADMLKRLTAAFWPGPLTLIVPRSQALPSNISSNDGIAVRIPDDELGRAVIRAAGGAAATSSANLSGQPPATSAEMAHDQLGARVTAIVDGGPSAQGIASTIVDCRSGQPIIVRPGPISAEDIAAVLAD